MRPTVPDWFAQRLRDFDIALRLRWSDDSRMFCLERRMSNTPNESIAPLKAELNRIANKPLKKPVPSCLYIPVEYAERENRRYRQGEAYRIKCKDQLAALNAGYHFIFHIPGPLDQYKLACVLYTLRQTDVWSHGGADKMAAGMDYEDQRAELARERSNASDQHELACDVNMMVQAKRGERIIHPGMPDKIPAKNLIAAPAVSHG